VTKLNATGTALIYSTYLGGNGHDSDNSIAVDASGNAYVSGDTFSTDFPTTPGAFQTSFGTGSDHAFVTKLNATGTAMTYSTYLGGNDVDLCNGIAVDALGNAYVTGQTTSTNFPTTANAFQTTFGGGIYDAFVTKLNASGTALTYSTYLGGNDVDLCNGIAVDALGNAYVSGRTSSTNFPTTPGAFQSSFGTGSAHAFVTKLNASGTALIYSTYLGGNGSDEARGTIALDGSGNAFVSGETSSTNFPTTPGAFQTSFGTGSLDAFVTKLNASGTALVYSTYLGGNDADSCEGIAVDALGNAYVTGITLSTDFPTTPDAFQTTFGGGFNDAFITKLNGTGTALIYSTYLGGNDLDVGHGITVDGSGNAYVTGLTASTNFPTTPGAFQTSRTPDWDAFVTKIAFRADTNTALTSSPNPSVYGDAVLFTATVTAANTPITSGTVTFREGSTVLAGGVALDASGHARFTTATLTPGASPHIITADYSGTPDAAPSSGSVSQTVTPALLTATGVNFTATAGAPFSGVVATFGNADPLGTTASYTATITWGDGNTSTGTVTDAGGGQFAVSGSNTYATPASYDVTVQISHRLGYTTPATAHSTATVVQLVATTVTCSVVNSLLWPPNHQLVNVGLNITVSPPGASVQVQVYANDQADASDAADIAPNTLELRAARQGHGSGRVYLIVVTATAGGQTASDVCTVVVPHDQSAHSIAEVQAAAATAEAYYWEFQTAPPGFQLIGSGPAGRRSASSAPAGRTVTPGTMFASTRVAPAYFANDAWLFTVPQARPSAANLPCIWNEWSWDTLTAPIFAADDSTVARPYAAWRDELNGSVLDLEMHEQWPLKTMPPLGMVRDG
jgi:hypothetical protein